MDLVEAVETVAAGALGSGLTPERVAARLSHPELAPAVHAPLEDQRAGDPERTIEAAASLPVGLANAFHRLLQRSRLAVFPGARDAGGSHPAHAAQNRPATSTAAPAAYRSAIARLSAVSSVGAAKHVDRHRRFDAVDRQHRLAERRRRDQQEQHDSSNGAPGTG